MNAVINAVDTNPSVAAFWWTSFRTQELLYNYYKSKNYNSCYILWIEFLLQLTANNSLKALLVLLDPLVTVLMEFHCTTRWKYYQTMKEVSCEWLQHMMILFTASKVRTTLQRLYHWLCNDIKFLCPLQDWKNLEFRLVLWAGSSNIFLAQGHSLLI